MESFQPHMHLRGKAMSIEAILPNGQMQVLSHVADFNFNWHNSYVYADDCGAAAAEGHDPQGHRVARQHRGEQVEPGSERVGRLWRSHGRRNGARVGQRDLHERRRLSGRDRRAHARRSARQRPRRSSNNNAHTMRFIDRRPWRLRHGDGVTRYSCRARSEAPPQGVLAEPVGNAAGPIFAAFEGWGPLQDGTEHRC